MRMNKWRLYEVYCGRPGVPPVQVGAPYKSAEIAERVRANTEKELNEFADPRNPWRVWVESKKDKPNDVWKRNLQSDNRVADIAPTGDAEDRDGPSAGY